MDEPPSTDYIFLAPVYCLIIGQVLAYIFAQHFCTAFLRRPNPYTIPL